jgi:hypothetical protein
MHFLTSYTPLDFQASRCTATNDPNSRSFHFLILMGAFELSFDTREGLTAQLYLIFMTVNLSPTSSRTAHTRPFTLLARPAQHTTVRLRLPMGSKSSWLLALRRVGLEIEFELTLVLVSREDGLKER